jgi:Domain of unknown function (DUF4386)
MDTARAPSGAWIAGSARLGRQRSRPAHRGTAALVGVLFLTSTASFAIGSSLIAGYFAGDSPGPSTLLAGVLLQGYTGLAVAGIGLAMLPLLRRHGRGLARAYLALRVLEGLAIGLVGAYLLASRRELPHADLLIYSFTAVGGIIFSYLLLVSGLVPRALSVLGMVGYVVLLVGVPTALAGVAELDRGWGTAFLVPGGLFELVLPLLLLVKGFTGDRPGGPAVDGPAVDGGATKRPRPRRTGTPLGDVTPRRAAIVAGLGLLAMTLLGFASFAGFERLVVEGDAALTARNIAAHELQFRLVTGGFVVIAGLDVLVGWALYVLLRPVNPSVAALSAWLRVAYAAAFAAASTNLAAAVNLLTDADSEGLLGPRPLDAQVMVSVRQFTDGWDVALVLFGLHLLVLGYLVFRSAFLPRVLGVLVAVASLGYLIDSFGALLWSGYEANVAGFTFAGEVLLMGWLLWRGASWRSDPTRATSGRPRASARTSTPEVSGPSSATTRPPGGRPSRTPRPSRRAGPAPRRCAGWPGPTAAPPGTARTARPGPTRAAGSAGGRRGPPPAARRAACPPTCRSRPS